MREVTITVCALAVLGSASCAPQSPSASSSSIPTPASIGVTSAPSQGPNPTPSTLGSPSQTPATSSSPNGSASSPTPNGPPIVNATPGATIQTLTLADAFTRGDWKSGSYTPANETRSVDAMAVEVPCSSYGKKQIEFRFAQVKGKLKAEIAQDMRSQSPDIPLEFALEADGKPRGAKNIEFTGKDELALDLSGVTVVRLVVQSAPSAKKKCTSINGSATALVTKLTIES